MSLLAETGGENLPSAPLEDSSKFFEEVFGDMVVALSFPEGKSHCKVISLVCPPAALSSLAALDLHKDELSVLGQTFVDKGAALPF